MCRGTAESWNRILNRPWGKTLTHRQTCLFVFPLLLLELHYIQTCRIEEKHRNQLPFQPSPNPNDMENHRMWLNLRQQSAKNNSKPSKEGLIHLPQRKRRQWSWRDACTRKWPTLDSSSPSPSTLVQANARVLLGFVRVCSPHRLSGLEVSALA